ncbi:MAG TPA: TolC family protein [Candidatus Methylomirabilis sp.]|nr:TolC family protein [Candidatus Methylomirabilis sp.]
MRWIGLTLCCLIAVLGGPPRAWCQSMLSRVSLNEALQLALQQNPTLRAQQFALDSTKAGEITAGLRPNPSMNFLAEQFGPGSDHQTQYTVNVGQPIELGGKRQRRLDSARAATRVAGYQVDDVRRQTILQVKTAFAGALIAQDQLALAEQNLKTLDETERLQRIRVDRGDLSALELLRIQVQRFTFERDAADARQALEAAKIALRAAAGDASIAPNFEIVGELGFKEIPLDRTALMRAALDNRPDLKGAEADRERARADHRLAQANAWWDITPQLEYQRIGPDNTIGFGFSIPIRVFDRNQGEIARTKAEIARVDAVREATALQVLAAVDTDLAAATTQQARVIALRDIYLPKATQARDTVDYAYRRGGASLLDFLDAQRSYRETALAHLQALGAYLSAIYQLEADVGRPLGE